MKSQFNKAAQSYVAPEVEVTNILLEGVLCASRVPGEAADPWGDDGDPIL
jgi:hypothetical protein